MCHDGKRLDVTLLLVLIMMTSVFGARACTAPNNCSIISKDYCYSARIRSTVLQGLPFGGVPTVLALDFMCFLVSWRPPGLGVVWGGDAESPEEPEYCCGIFFFFSFCSLLVLFFFFFFKFLKQVTLIDSWHQIFMAAVDC
uniref:Zgc:153431 n=1 Tax=Paramormyrops kingsleyae TaxID=1676925 RepID=A0A3B3RJK2_9TELE